MAGLATQGDLWFERNGGTNNIILAVDEIELWQGARERVLVSQKSVTTNTTAYTNHVWDWSLDDPSGKTWTDSRYDGTNWINTTNTYKLGVLGTNVWYVTNNNPTEITLPETVDYFRWEQTNAQKFIQGAWSNITFSGFDDPAFSNLNGTYTFDFRKNVIGEYDTGGYFVDPRAADSFFLGGGDTPYGFMMDGYTNGTQEFSIHDILGWLPISEVVANRQYDKGYAYRGNGAMFTGSGGNDKLKLRGDPVLGQVEFGQFSEYFNPGGGNHDIANVTVGDLIPNMTRDLPTFDVDFRKNAIDGIISFKKFIKITDAGRGIYDSKGLYVDHTLATGTEFVGYTNIPVLVATQVWDRLGIDYPMDDTWQTNTIVLATNYAERYLAFNYAEWSHTRRTDNTDTHQWTSPYPTNGVHAPTAINGQWDTGFTNGVLQYGVGLSTSAVMDDATSWDLAKTRAEANSANASSGIAFGGWLQTYDRASPHSRLTFGDQATQSTNYIYTARFLTKQAKTKASGMDTGIDDKSIGFWFVVASPNAEIPTVNSVYDAYESGYTSNTYNQAGGSNYLAGASASVTSDVLGLLTIPTPWTDQPMGVGINNETIRGYVTEGDGDANGIQADIAWTPASNVNYYVYNGRGSTWDQAKSRASGNLIAALNTKDLPSSPDFNDYGQTPVCGTYGVSSAGVTGFTTNYLQAKAEWDEVYLITTNYNEMSGETDGYLLIEDYNRNEATTNTTFDANGTLLTDITSIQRFSTNSPIVSGVATSGWITTGFSATNLPAWTDEPAYNNKSAKGFQRKLGSADAEDMVLKWDFIYCTNSL